MRIYKTLAETKTILKPVSIKQRAWTFGSSISQIINCKRTHSGNYVYTVKLKDNRLITVAEKNLPGKYKKLARGLKPPPITKKPKRKLTLLGPKSVRSRPPPVIYSDSSSDESYVDNKIDNFIDDDIPDYADDMADYDEEMPDYDDDMFDFEDMSTPPEQSATTTTHSGRKTVQPKIFSQTYQPTQPRQPKKQNIEHTFHIPPYTDDSFKEHHSDSCFKCNQESSKDSQVQEVSIGINEPRSRLLLCSKCSLSFHNNCVATSAIHIEKETGQLTCSKCVKSEKCYGCDDSLLTKNKTTPLRCSTCFRAFHFDCLVPAVSTDLKETIKVYDSIDIYTPSRCFECTVYLSKVLERIVDERLVNDKLEYLVKWKTLSFRKADWVAASWVSHAYSAQYKNYLKKKAQGKIVPFSKEWLVIDRILNVRWDTQGLQKPLSVLAVFKDRDYSEAVWDDPPSPLDTDLYPDYEIALNRYIQSTNVSPPENIKHLISQVRSQATAENYEKHELKKQPKFIKGGQLMKHQLDALNWLIYQWEKDQSCILADDMGLGKTIQIVTFLYYLYKKFSIYPFLVVVPNSTATNWMREFGKWAPDLVVSPYFGSKEAKHLALTNEIYDQYTGKLKCHAVVCTYESALERSTLYNEFWPVMVVDESQRLKNDESLLFKNLNKLKVDYTVLLTGTPLQNNLRELFNIMNFIQPKSFKGDQAEQYEELNATQVEELHARLRPHFLRRTKEEVLKTLPPKYELIVPVSMTTLQKEVYKQCLSGEIHETLAQATMAKRQKGLSSIFMNLRKVLNHPYLLDGVETSQPSLEETQRNMINASAKLKLLHQMLPKLIERGHRILIFSTMTRTLNVLEDYLDYEKIPYARIDGSTRERERVRQIDAFNAPDSKIKVFLLSTRAGGVGINLATADTVIIWDSDFNPYADFQAISRAHRIGQTKMVLIYRLMTRLTVEEKVLQIAKKRIALEHVVVEKMNDTEEENFEDIESILKYGTEALFSDDGPTDITYDTAAIENLLDREQYREVATKQQKEEVEEMADKASAMNFSFAKVWQADGTTQELPSEEAAETEADTDFWDKFLKEQQEMAEKKKEEKRLEELNYGRGARKRAVITYNEKVLLKGPNDEPMEETNEEISQEKDDDYTFEVEEVSESELASPESQPQLNDAPHIPPPDLATVYQQVNNMGGQPSHTQMPLQGPSSQFAQYQQPQQRQQSPQILQSMQNLQTTPEQKPQPEKPKPAPPQTQIRLTPAQMQQVRAAAQQQFKQPVQHNHIQQHTQHQQPVQQNHPIMQHINQHIMQAQQQNYQQPTPEFHQQEQFLLQQHQMAQLEQPRLLQLQQQQQRQLQERQQQEVIRFMTDVNRKSLMRWIAERILDYKEQSERSISTNTFSIELFSATRTALAEDIRNYLYERSKMAVDRERQEEVNRGLDASAANSLHTMRLRIANENIKQIEAHIRSELDKLQVELSVIWKKKQQDTANQLSALQVLVQQQEAERKALEDKQKRELVAATTGLMLPQQTLSFPTRQAITYSAPQQQQQQTTTFYHNTPSTASMSSYNFNNNGQNMMAQQFINPMMLNNGQMSFSNATQNASIFSLEELQPDHPDTLQ